MKGYINKERIAYVFYHLRQLFQADIDIEKDIVFVKNSIEIEQHKKKIIFILSDRKYNNSAVKWVSEIPVLFPCSDKEAFFFERNGSIIFYDDLIKSAFYLLSGYQEINTKEFDHLNRFSFLNSLQKELGIIDKPVVNYYFRQILKGFERFCDINGFPFKEKTIFEKPVLFLSHDIDYVDYYDIYFIGDRIKEILGLSERRYNKRETWRLLLKGVFNFFNPLNKENPYWNFEYLLDLEKKNKLTSTFFILTKDQKHKDAYFKFTDKRIVKLLQQLLENKKEVGLHGTIRSSEDKFVLKKLKDELEKVINHTVFGVRQHRLILKYPQTLKNHSFAGFSYDTTYGFADHEGFRNAYCYPFKPYDFANESMIDVWEIPLNVMDVTLFGYRQLSFDEANERVFTIFSEIEKFNGVLSLLWHNSFFDEIKYPGITDFYEGLLFKLAEKNIDSMPGCEIVQMVKK